MAKLHLEKYKHLLNAKANEQSELRFHENRTLSLALVDGQLVSNAQNKNSGVSSRTFESGAWGFSSHPEFAESNVIRVLNESRENAKALARYHKTSHQLFPNQAAQHSFDASSAKSALSTEQLIARLNEVDSYILQNYPKITQRKVMISQQDFLKETITSSGSHIYSHYARSFLFLHLGLSGKNGHVSLYEIFGGRGQLQDTLPDLNSMKEKIEKLYQFVLEKSEGVHAEAGLKEVILSSKLAGILAHEAIGHTTEADFVKGGSIAGSFLEKQIASPKINLVDYAHTYNNELAPMPVFFDDEGTKAEDTWIIKDGVLKTFMNSRETASEFNQKATGHARAWAFNDEPLIRMRNTAIVPGFDDYSDMIGSIDDGYLLLNPGNGQADSTSEFMFGVTMGYEIKKGQLGKAILDTTISGVAFDMLKNVSMISNEMTWSSAGTCGKKQPMTVGMGGPSIKCSINIGGK